MDTEIRQRLWAATSDEYKRGFKDGWVFLKSETRKQLKRGIDCGDIKAKPELEEQLKELESRILEEYFY